MKVYVVGGGAVGRYLGGLLADHGGEVIYAPRDLEQVVPIDGLDLALVAVKSYDTPGAVETLRRALGRAMGTTILTVQNGIGAEEQLAEAFGADAVASGALTVPVQLDDDRVLATGSGGLGIAPVGGASINWLLAAFGSTGIEVRSYADYRALKWSKLVINLVANATCAILDSLPEHLVKHPGAFRLEVHALREAVRVVRAQGIALVDLPRYRVRALANALRLPSALARLLLASRVAGARGEKPPSLLLDLRSGRPRTEVSALNGAVVRAGKAAGVPTPVNAVLTDILEDIVRSQALWAKYRQRPEALIARVDEATGGRW
ncbi:MAG TPA: ketopantoate reductase C-terminal domain-containing protein [Candidatus Dormibacteraeota bacterium]|nr:ketopantoate reductase C-terminal domain-containing protein [Candidatus Dormibacteraeota bacterium]